MPLSSLLQRKIGGQPVLAGYSANSPAQFEDERSSPIQWGIISNYDDYGVSAGCSANSPAKFEDE